MRRLIILCRAVPMNDERIVVVSDLLLNRLGQGLKRRHLLIIIVPGSYNFIRRLLCFALDCLILLTIVIENFLCRLGLSRAVIISFHFR